MDVTYDPNVWIPIAADPRYEINCLAQVRRAVPGRGARVGRLVMPRMASRTRGSHIRYLIVNLSNGTYYLHRLVCEAFHGKCPEGFECDHIDHDPYNLHPSNLRWLERKTNRGHRKNPKDWSKTPRGSGHGMAKINETTALDIKLRLSSGSTASDVAAALGISYKTVNAIHVGRTWKHVPWPEEKSLQAS